MNKTFLLALSLLASAPAVAAVDTQYDDLVRLARTGDTAPVLDYLKRHQTDQSVQQREDNIVIASWAGRDQETVAAYRRYPNPEQLSAEVLGTVARAHRNLKQYAEAAALYRKAQHQVPDDPQWVMGEMLVLADDGKGGQAVALGKPWVDRLSGEDQAQMRTVMAYALLSEGARYEALHQMERAFVTEYPGDFQGELRERYGQVLTRGEMPMAALSIDAGLTPLQRLQKQSDEMALRVRVAVLDSRRESERLQATDEALARYASLLKQCAATPGADAIARQMRIDRLGLYDGRGMPQQVVSEYDVLKAQGGEVPPYARVWVARSLLKLRQPARAERLMASAVKETEAGQPQPWMAGRILHAQTLTLCHRIDDAAREIERIMPLEGRYRWVINYPQTEIDSTWLTLQLNHASLLNDKAQNEPALAVFEDLCRYNLGSTETCVPLADMYRNNGWPRRSEQRLKLVEGVSPRALELEESQAYTALALREWHQADVLTDDVAQRYPEDYDVGRLVRANEVAHMAELRLTASPDRSSGSSTVRGSHSLAMEGTLFSPRFLDHWRVFAGSGYSSSRFEEEKGHGRWQRAGVEYSGRDLQVSADTRYQNYGVGHEQGYRFTLDHDLSDIWHWGTLVARRSTDAPLRARIAGVHADQYQAYGRWTPDDERAWELAYTHWDFSDRNRHQQVALSGEHRLWAITDLRVDGLLDVGGRLARYSTDAQSYYSPKHDVAVMPSLRLTHRLYAFYENQWQQTFELGAGHYWEARYGSSPMLMARYGQQLQTNDVLALGATVGWERQSYDGRAENDLQLSFDMNYRF